MLHGDFGIPFQSPTETVVEVVLRARLHATTSARSHRLRIRLRHAPGTIAVQAEQRDRQPRDLRRDAGAWRCLARPMAGPGHRRGGAPAVAAHRWLGRAEAPHHARQLVLPGADGHRRPDDPRQPPGDLSANTSGSRAHGASRLGSSCGGCSRTRPSPRSPCCCRSSPTCSRAHLHRVFNVPGLGRFFTTSALTRDYPTSWPWR